MYAYLYGFNTNALLLCGKAQGQGYDYNRPDKAFVPSSATTPSRFPGLQSQTNGYPSESGVQTPSGNGYPTPRPVGPGQALAAQPGAQIQPGQAPAQNFPAQGPAGQYPNQAQSSTIPPSRYPGQAPSFPRFSPQQSQFSGSEAPSFSGTGQQFSESSKPNFDNGLEGQYPEGSQDDGQYRSENDDGDYSAIPGEPEVDYPIYSYIPETSFKCEEQQYPGYYADVETRCQIFHICANSKMYDFLCPNGTVFHQEYLVCVWWNQFDCNSAPSLYGINANIYDYSRMYPSQQGLEYSPSAQGPGQPGYTPESETVPQRYPGPTSQQQTPGFTSPGTAPGYPGSRPQSSSFAAPQDYPQQQTPDYSKGKPQRPTASFSGTTPSYSGFTSQRRPGYPSSQPQTPSSNEQGITPGFPGSTTRQPENGYPKVQPQGPAFSSQTPGYPKQTSDYSQIQSQSPAFNAPQTAPGYPENQYTQPQQPTFTTQQISPGYPKPKYPQTQGTIDFTSQNVAPGFNGVTSQNQAPGYSTLQPQGPAFTSTGIGYPETAPQTPSYPEASSGTVAGYPGSQTPSGFAKPSQGFTTPRAPTPGPTYPETSYPKPQTPLPGFGSTEFLGSPSYTENGQTPGYPAPSKPSVPFFDANDVQQQRQYLPPVNG